MQNENGVEMIERLNFDEAMVQCGDLNASEPSYVLSRVSKDRTKLEDINVKGSIESSTALL